MDVLFEPHGHCYLWTPSILWPSLAYDAVIALSYFAIPILIYHRRQLPDAPWAQYLFMAFIVLCGMTHIMDIVTVFVPIYYQQNIVKGLCAGVSLCTALAMCVRPPR